MRSSLWELWLDEIANLFHLTNFDLTSPHISISDGFLLLYAYLNIITFLCLGLSLYQIVITEV